MELPTIGCAKSVLVGSHGPLGLEWGSTAPIWVPGMTRMQPLSRLAGESASQAVTTSGLDRPQ